MDDDTLKLRAAWSVRYWFCIDNDGTPLLFDYYDEPERVPGRGWIGKYNTISHSIDKSMISRRLLLTTNYHTEPVEVVFSPLENMYYQYNYNFELSRHRNLFPEHYR